MRTMRTVKMVLLSLWLTVLPYTYGQGAHRVNQVIVKGNNVQANVSPYASVLVCVAGTGCASTASVYSDVGLTNALAQPVKADAAGNYQYYISGGCVDEQISAPGQSVIFLANICPVNGTGGGITTIGIATANGIQGSSSGGATPTLTLGPDPTHVIPTNTGLATTYLNGAGTYTVPATGTGTVTSVSGLSPLFSVATGTSTPTFALYSQNAHTYLGNNTNSSGPPNFYQPSFLDLSGAIALGQMPFTYTGNTTKLATSTGSIVSGHCAKFDSSGNVIDAGSACTAGSVLFSAVTAATNTASLVVGTGGSLVPSGSGIITPSNITNLVAAGTNVTITGNGTLATPYTFSAAAASAVNFANLLTGTNTTATMTVGTGGSIVVSGGTVQATNIAGTLAAGTNITLTGSGTTASPYSISAPAPSQSFANLTSGVNTTMNSQCGSGCSLGITGTGVINASQVNGVTYSGSPVAGQVPYAASATSVSWENPTISGLLAAGAGVTLTGSGTAASPYTLATTSSAPSFSAITTGANTTATMTVGSGGSIVPTGTGSVQATNISGTVVAGTNIAISGSGTVASPYSVANTGVTSLNSLTGGLTLVPGSNVTITPSGSNITIASSGGGVNVFSTTPTGTVNGVNTLFTVPNNPRLLFVTRNNVFQTPGVQITTATAVPPPGTITPVSSTTGGTLPAATYYYIVTATNSYGETLGSVEASVTTTGTTSSVALSWGAVTGATGYKVYRGTVARGENLYYTTSTNSYTDTNATSTPGTVPSTSTAGAYFNFNASYIPAAGDALYAQAIY